MKFSSQLIDLLSLLSPGLSLLSLLSLLPVVLTPLSFCRFLSYSFIDHDLGCLSRLVVETQHLDIKHSQLLLRVLREERGRKRWERRNERRSFKREIGIRERVQKGEERKRKQRHKGLLVVWMCVHRYLPLAIEGKVIFA